MSADRQQSQRLDRWLWFARLVKSRTRAQALIEAGHVRVNRERVAAASQPVRPGDVLTITLEHAIKVWRVTALADRRGPADEARRLYIDLLPDGEAGQRHDHPTRRGGL